MRVKNALDQPLVAYGELAALRRESVVESQPRPSSYPPMIMTARGFERPTLACARVPDTMTIRRIPGFCALCRSRCGCISVVEDGRLVAVEPDPSHPTGHNLFVKGRAAPELVYAPDRLLYPMRRTRAKSDPDAGWVRIGWDEALAWTAERMRAVAGRDGPEAVAFAVTTPAGTAVSDGFPWITRLITPLAARTWSGARSCVRGIATTRPRTRSASTSGRPTLTGPAVCSCGDTTRRPPIWLRRRRSPT